MKFKVTYNVCNAQEIEETKFDCYGKEQAIEETEADTTDEAIENIMDWIVDNRSNEIDDFDSDKSSQEIMFYTDGAAATMFNHFVAIED